MPDNISRLGTATTGSQPGRGTLQSMRGSLEPTLSTGAVSVNFPLKLTPARTLTPSLSLSYHSNQGNSIFGMGFDLTGILSISRNTKFGVPVYDDTIDTFVLSNSGELVTVKEEDNIRFYRPRLDNEFSAIEYHIAEKYWLIREANGVNHYLGQDDTSRLAGDPGIFQWSVDHSVDAYGNQIQYQYVKENTPITGGSLTSQSFYLKSIQYGHYIKANKENFAFYCTFDYGETDAVEKDIQGNPLWLKSTGDRPDQFTEHRAGFAVSTPKLCRRILLYHRFDEANGLVKYWQITYNTDTVSHGAVPQIISLIQQIQEIGCQFNNKKQYITKALPPACFEYANFQAEPVAMSSFNLDAQDIRLPGLRGYYQWVDLYREGLSGILYSDENNALYWRSKGGGQFAAPLQLNQFPNNMELSNSSCCRIMSLGKEQQPALVVSIDEQAGYYLLDKQQTYLENNQYHVQLSDYQPFASFPMEFLSANGELIDLNGSGQSDLVILDTNYPYFYPAAGTLGFSNAQLFENLPDDFPRGDHDANALVIFTDIFGDGLLHRVKVNQDGIDIWPNLGHGIFSQKIHWDLPAIKDDFDSIRVFLVDIDGSGADDFVYVYPTHITVFFNQGKGFSDQTVTLNLPETYNHQDRLLFGNFLGLATNQVIFIKTDIDENRYYYGTFAQYKPHLLVKMVHALGIETTFEYASSIDVYLKDPNRDLTNTERLPFALSVLNKTTITDPLTKVTSLEIYQYHAGHYNFVEKQFCGFGFVTKLHQEMIACDHPINATIADSQTKYWFHQGVATELFDLFHPFDVTAILPIGRLNHYYKTQEGKDEDLPVLDKSANPDALYALRGRLLCQESWSTTDTNIVPLFVRLYSYNVRCEQDSTLSQHGVFVVQSRESLDILYQKNEKKPEPRIAHQINLSFDQYSRILGAMEIQYGRTSCDVHLADDLNLDVITRDAVFDLQKTNQILYHVNHYATQTTEEFRFLHIIAQQQSFDLSEGIQIALPLVFTEIKTLANRIDLQKLVYQERLWYWDDAQQQALQGYFQQRPLLHHQEKLLGNSAQTLSWYQAVLQPSESIVEVLKSNGYILDQDQWWQPSHVIHYGSVAQYYQKSEILSYFNTDTARPNLFYHTAVICDEYSLTIITINRYLTPTQMFTQQRTIDYQSMQACQEVDHNQNITLNLYNPLDLLMAMTKYGRLQDKTVGNPITDEANVMTSAELTELAFNVSQKLSTISLDNIAQQSADYVGDWLQVFCYDFEPLNNGPAFFLEIIQQNYAKRAISLIPQALSQISIKIHYFDSFGREIQTKYPAEESKWFSSGAQIYSHNHQLLQQSLPMTTEATVFDPMNSDANKTLRNHYDENLKLITQLLPDGHQRQYVRTAWFDIFYDQNAVLNDPAFPYAPNITFKDAAGNATAHLKIRSDDEDKYILVRSQFNVLKRIVSKQDARLKESNLQVTYNLLGREVCHQSVDRGQESYLHNYADTLTRRHLGDWLHQYEQDSWQRLLRTKVSRGNEEPVAIELREYGETRKYPELTNSCGQLVSLSNEEGVYRWQLFDLREKCIQHDRDIFLPTVTQHISEVLQANQGPHSYEQRADIANSSSGWESETFEFLTEYNVLGSVLAKQLPDGNVQVRAYNKLDQLANIQIGRTISDLRLIASDIKYQEMGFRTQIQFANHLMTTCDYDPLTQRLKHVKTTGSADAILREQVYQFDPMGKIIGVEHKPSTLPISSDLVHHTAGGRIQHQYDALGRLHSTEGHELALKPVKSDALHIPQSLFSDQPTLQAYTQRFIYDKSHNITDIHHQGSKPWQLNFNIQEESNRFETLTTADNKPLAADSAKPLYDAAGNMQQLDASSKLTWDHTNQLRQVSVAPTESDPQRDIVKEFYAYKGSAFEEVPFTDESGNQKTAYTPSFFGKAANHHMPFDPKPLARYGSRLYKVSCFEKIDGSIQVVKQLFLGAYERKEIFDVNKEGKVTTTLIRHTHNVTDDNCQIATYHYWTVDILKQEAPTAASSVHLAEQLQFHISDNIHSSVMDVDDQGYVLSVEAYQAFGQIAYIITRDAAQLARKDYHYSSQIRDQVSGLYYYGARYYAPRLGRWISPDPAGLVDGTNLYGFVGEDPLNFWDEEGFWQTILLSRNGGQPTAHFISQNGLFLIPQNDPNIIYVHASAINNPTNNVAHNVLLSDRYIPPGPQDFQHPNQAGQSQYHMFISTNNSSNDCGVEALHRINTERTANAHAYANTYAHAYANNANIHANNHAYANTLADAHAHANTYAHALAYANAYAHAHAQTRAQAYAQAYAQAPTHHIPGGAVTLTQADVTAANLAVSRQTALNQFISARNALAGFGPAAIQNDAEANVGEAYITIPQGVAYQGPPNTRPVNFHVAFVIGQDGQDRVISETNAAYAHNQDGGHQRAAHTPLRVGGDNLANNRSFYNRNLPFFQPLQPANPSDPVVARLDSTCCIS